MEWRRWRGGIFFALLDNKTVVLFVNVLGDDEGKIRRELVSEVRLSSCSPSHQKWCDKPLFSYLYSTKAACSLVALCVCSLI